MHNPLVSIIIPIYNVEKYLKECLDSVIKQKYSNLDIILVDDGSNDKSLDIALEYLNKDERIFLVSKENGGLSSARNLGLEFIKGTKLRSFFEDGGEQDIISFVSTHTFDKNTKIINKEIIKSNFIQVQKRYIKTGIENINDLLVQELPNSIVHFLDSDDYFLSDCIKLCVQQMIEKDLDICMHRFDEYHEKNKQFVKNPPTDLMRENRKIIFNTGIKLLQENNFRQFYFSCFGVFKAKILNQYNLRFTHGIYHEDHDFGTILFCLAKKVFYDKNNCGYIYRIRKGSITNIQNVLIPEKLPKYLEPLKKYFNNYKELREYFKIYCLLKIAKQLYDFNISINNKFLKKSIKEYYMYYFNAQIIEDPLKINEKISLFVKNIKFYKKYLEIRMLIRHPKKIFKKSWK